MRTSQVTWLVSMGVHGLIFLGSPPLRSAHQETEPPSSLVHFSVPEPAPSEEPALPEPEPEPVPPTEAVPPPEPEVAPPEPEQPAALETAAVEAPPEPAADAASPEPPAEPPSDPAAAPVEAELTGTTLTGEGGWSAEAGSGRARRGAITAGSSRAATPAARPAPAPAPPAPGPPAAVPLKDLAKKPGPQSSVGDLLQRNYPADERAHGVAGRALVRARIEPSGRVQTVEIVGASNGHFGEACRKTLQQSRWSAPRDEKGRAVPTWIKYRCDFVVQR